MRALLWARFLMGIAMVLGATASLSQTYPDRPVRLIVPFAAGTATDVISRAVVIGLSKSLGPIVVDNKPGALGAIATAEAARARPDGYTLLIGGTTSMSAGPQMLKQKPSYDAEADFVPIGRIAGVVFALVVRPELGVNTLDEFVQLARQRKAKPLSCGYANSANLASCAVLVHEAKFEAVRVPYKAVPQMMQDLLGGVVDFTVVDLANALPLVRAGKLKALAITTPAETPELPGVPPMNRVAKDFQLLIWTGLFAPKGTPESVVTLLSDRLRQAMADPDTRNALVTAGNLLFYGDAKEMRAYLAEDIARWASLIKTANIQPE